MIMIFSNDNELYNSENDIYANSSIYILPNARKTSGRSTRVFTKRLRGNACFFFPLP